MIFAMETRLESSDRKFFGSVLKLQTQLTVRTEADEIKVIRVRLAVDQNQVGPDMAVPVVFP